MLVHQALLPVQHENMCWWVGCAVKYGVGSLSKWQFTVKLQVQKSACKNSPCHSSKKSYSCIYRGIGVLESLLSPLQSPLRFLDVEVALWILRKINSECCNRLKSYRTGCTYLNLESTSVKLWTSVFIITWTADFSRPA